MTTNAKTSTKTAVRTRAKSVPAKAKAEANGQDKNTAMELDTLQAEAISGVKLAIVKDKDAVSSYVNQAIKNYLRSGYEIHVAFVSSLWHTVVHGNPAPLNRLYAALRSNDQAAVRLFLRRAHILVALKGEDPEGLDSEVIKAAAQQGSAVGFEKGTFFVIQDRMENRKALRELCEKRFINPKGSDKFLMQRNNVAEVRTIGDTEAVDSVIRTLKGYLGESTDRRKFDITDPVRKIFQKTLDGFESLKTQVTTG